MPVEEALAAAKQSLEETAADEVTPASSGSSGAWTPPPACPSSGDPGATTRRSPSTPVSRPRPRRPTPWTVSAGPSKRHSPPPDPRAGGRRPGTRRLPQPHAQGRHRAVHRRLRDVRRRGRRPGGPRRGAAGAPRGLAQPEQAPGLPQGPALRPLQCRPGRGLPGPGAHRVRRDRPRPDRRHAAHRLAAHRPGRPARRHLRTGRGASHARHHLAPGLRRTPPRHPAADLPRAARHREDVHGARPRPPSGRRLQRHERTPRPVPPRLFLRGLLRGHPPASGRRPGRRRGQRACLRPGPGPAAQARRRGGTAPCRGVRPGRRRDKPRHLAKIFGELYFFLEYRNERVHLLYGSDDGRVSVSRPTCTSSAP